MDLCDADIKMLAASWITPDLARSAGLFRVDTYQGGALIGATVMGITPA